MPQAAPCATARPSRFTGVSASRPSAAPDASRTAHTMDKVRGDQRAIDRLSSSAGPNIAARCSSTIVCGATASARHHAAISGNAAIIGSIASPASSVGHCSGVAPGARGPGRQRAIEQAGTAARRARPARRCGSAAAPATTAVATRRIARGAWRAPADRPMSPSTRPAPSAPRLAADDRRRRRGALRQAQAAHHARGQRRQRGPAEQAPAAARPRRRRARSTTSRPP